jgi:hypothetical protein
MSLHHINIQHLYNQSHQLFNNNNKVMISKIHQQLLLHLKRKIILKQSLKTSTHIIKLRRVKNTKQNIILIIKVEK